MRKILISTLLAGAAAVIPTSSANAAYVYGLVDPSCDLTAGCLFDILGVPKNITGDPDSVLAIEKAYNDAHNPTPPPATIDLEFLYKTEGSLEATSGTFTLPGGFDFYAIKAASDQFVLYQVAPGTTSVNWNTNLLLNKNGNPQDASHIVAYSGTPPIPEPATWAMMLAGFGAVGYSMRRRQNVKVSFA